MKFRLLLPVLIFAFSVSAETAKTFSSPEESLRQAASDRMDYLEGRYGIKFDRKVLKGIFFGIPSEDDPTTRAEYVPSEGSIYMHLGYIFRFTQNRVFLGECAFKGDPQLNRDPALLFLLDHELGHALADQVSRRIGNGIWPPMDEYSKFGRYKRYGRRIISEGIAGFFSYSAWELRKSKGENSLPEESDLDYWRSDEAQGAFYDGGYWLVKPILEEFGEKGLGYLMIHPVEFPDGNARKAAKEYQKRALAELRESVK